MNYQTRPLTVEEYKNVMLHINQGFTDSNKVLFKPNNKLALALYLQANTGLRISDILNLRVNSFKGSKMEIKEKKTGKLQWREVNQDIVNAVLEFALDKGLKGDNLLFSRFSSRAVNKHLKRVTDYIGLTNISTHSFRKLYATMQYNNNDKDLYLVKELLNHSSISTTQRYIRTSQEQINKASKSFYIG